MSPSGSYDLSDPTQNDVTCIYDGQISEGRPHGFGRAIYGEQLKVYSGLMKNGS